MIVSGSPSSIVVLSAIGGVTHQPVMKPAGPAMSAVTPKSRRVAAAEVSVARSCETRRIRSQMPMARARSVTPTALAMEASGGYVIGDSASLEHRLNQREDLGFDPRDFGRALCLHVGWVRGVVVGGEGYLSRGSRLSATVAIPPSGRGADDL